MTDERLQFLKAFVDDPEANGGLDWLQDCGIDAIEELLGELETLQTKLDTVMRAIEFAATLDKTERTEKGHV